MAKVMSFKDRFNQFIKPENARGCRLWLGAQDKKGYGMFWHNGRSIRAHRASWEIHCGPIPAGMKVLHKCDIPSCVNPDHLFVGSSQDNTDDMRKKGRERYSANPPRGERQGRSKLSAQNIERIRADCRTQQIIADEYGIDRSHVSKLKAGKRWQHLGA